MLSLNFRNKNLNLKACLLLAILVEKSLCGQTFNVYEYSGTAVKELLDYFKIDAKDVIVFHDDLDIDFGKVKPNSVAVTQDITALSL